MKKFDLISTIPAFGAMMLAVAMSGAAYGQKPKTTPNPTPPAKPLTQAAAPNTWQLTLNFGLSHPQPDSLMPHWRSTVVMPTPKPKTAAVARLENSAPGLYRLAGGWEMAEETKVIASPMSVLLPGADTRQWYNAVVPGTVLTTLVEAGIFPEPSYGMNNMAIPDSLCRMGWWYRLEFNAPEDIAGRTADLVFDGINYKAEVWLNGTRAGRITGAFRQGVFDVTRLLRSGDKNVLAVRILPPNNPSISHEESIAAGQGPNGGTMAMDGPTFFCSEGWDWIPGVRDRETGLWQDVWLRFTAGIAIGEPKIVTDLPLPDTTRAKISVTVPATNRTSAQKEFTLRGKFGSVSFSRKMTLAAGATQQVSFTPADYPQLEVKNPALWWPNGMGRPQLQTLVLEAATADGKVSDTRTTRFGIREFSYELTMDMPGEKDVRVEYSPTDALKGGAPLIDNLNRRELGDKTWVPSLRAGADASAFTRVSDNGVAPYLIIKVNGVPVYCKGGNWGLDEMLKRSSRERLEPAFRLHRDAGLNMVRNWCGQNTEEVFYALSDEYGMLVWNDFWMSSQFHNLNPADDGLWLDNARDVVQRFRNHPSIVIWNPRNEGFAPDYIEDQLNLMVTAEDGTRHYQPNSQHMNLCKTGPWRYFADASVYFNNFATGFTTEQGTPSVPTFETMQATMDPVDLWPIGDVWAYHDLHSGQPDYLKDIAAKYGPSNDAEEFCRKAQMINYDSHRALYEAWNGRMWRSTSGFLLWMTHPAWPSTVWQIYSSDYETPASYFAVKKACEPLHIQANPDGAIVAVNAGPTGVKTVATRRLYDLAGQPLSSEQRAAVDLTANTVADCFKADYSGFSGAKGSKGVAPQVYVERLILADAKGRVLSVNDYLRTTQQGSAKGCSFAQLNQLDKAQIGGRIVSRGADGVVALELTNRSKSAAAVALKLNLRNAAGERILPAYFSDGYFNLLPGEKRTITIDGAGVPKGCAVSVEGYNVERATLIKL